MIFFYRNEILTQVNNQPMVIVSGLTGSGKTTQVCGGRAEGWGREGEREGGRVGEGGKEGKREGGREKEKEGEKKVDTFFTCAGSSVYS